jgi:hypothetical protein
MKTASESEQTMEERIAAFRSDPQLMEVATKFVNDVLEKAKEEALRRLKEKAAVSLTLVEAKRRMCKWGIHVHLCV